MKEDNKLPEGWKWVRLGEVCETTSGGTPSRKEPKYYQGKIPWVKSGELDKGLITDTEEKITKGALENSSAKLFPKGTLLIAIYGATIGKLAFLGVDAATNQAICGIYENDILNSHFLYYYLSFKKQDLVGLGTGGAQPNISQTILKNLRLPLPPIEAQKDIVSKIEELFSELDKGIENLRIAQQQLKTYRQAVLKWAFEGRLTNENVKEEEFPKDWKSLTLGEICDPQRKCSYGVLVPGDNLDKGIRLLRVGDIDECGRINQTEMKRISPAIANKFKRTFLQGGEIVITLVGRIGSTAVIPISLKGANTARAVGVIPVDRNISAKFIELMLRSPNKIREHNRSAHEVARKTLNLEDVVKSKIPFPSTDEQMKIIEIVEYRLSIAEQMESTINIYLEKTFTLKQSILRRTFEGKLI